MHLIFIIIHTFLYMQKFTILTLLLFSTFGWQLSAQFSFTNKNDLIGERLLVGPAFHRLHHGIGLGHESDGKGSLGGCNFSVLFPVWDALFGTARFGVPAQPTGIRDQLPEEGGRDYGRGFWAQQWLGAKRLLGTA